MLHDRIESGVGVDDPKLVRSFSYIGGKWVGASDGATLTVTNPADGSTVGEVAKLSAAESTQAVDAAQAAFPAWAGSLPQDRGALLRRWYELMVQNAEDLARIMVAEQGKPISEARGEIAYAASFVEYYAEEAKRPDVEGVTSHLPDAEVELWMEPVGVAALVTPWNFPSAMLTRKAAAALAAGCTVVAHPSGETPFSATALAELAERAGFPAGVFNLVTGDAPTVVAPWTADSRVRALSFTGSTEIGRLLYRQSADTVKKLVMELGGHAPVIVCEDADIELAVKAAGAAKVRNAGQVCISPTRFLVHDSVYDRFAADVTSFAEQIKVGDGLTDGTTMGPLANPRRVNAMRELTEDATSRGVEVLTGVAQIGNIGNFWQPTVMSNVPTDARVFNEEPFGPVIAMQPFKSLDDAITEANRLDYGLAGYAFTGSLSRADAIARGVEVGMMWINMPAMPSAEMPFGGVKDSGYGSEGGPEAMDCYVNIRSIAIKSN